MSYVMFKHMGKLYFHVNMFIIPVSIFLFSYLIFFWKPLVPKPLPPLTVVVNKMKQTKIANTILHNLYCVIPSLPVSLQHKN